MSDAQIEKLIELQQQTVEAINRQSDELARQNELLEKIGNVFVPAKEVTKRLGLNKDTLQKNQKIEKFQPIGENVNFVRLGDLVMIQNRKTKAERAKLRRK
jgi:hypothetical protein